MKISTQLVPPFASTLLTRMALGVGVWSVAIGITSAILTQPASAQSAESLQPLGDFTTQQNERDSFSGTSGGFSVFDLIHRSQLGSPRDVNEFISEQRESLNNAAEEYRRQQLLRLGNPLQVSPANPATTPPMVNPPSVGGS